MRAHQLLFQDRTFALCCLFQVSSDSIHPLSLLSTHYFSRPAAHFSVKSFPCHTSATSLLTPLFATHPKTRLHKPFSCHTYDPPGYLFPTSVCKSCDPLLRASIFRFRSATSARPAVPLRRTLCSAKMRESHEVWKQLRPFWCLTRESGHRVRQALDAHYASRMRFRDAGTGLQVVPGNIVQRV